MHSSIVLLAASLGLAAARQQPYMMYGVPMGGEDISMDDLVTLESDVSVKAAAANGTQASNSTKAPAPTQAPTVPAGTEPCAVVSSAIKAIPSGSRKVIPAELGIQCLQSVPLDKDGDIQLIDDLKLYLQWQSNIAYLKNPPETYTEKPVDMIGEMDSMRKQLQSGGYANEYDFQLDLNQLFARAYDNHLSWQSDIIASVMQFQRAPGMELVSVSSDGNALPEIFAYRDMELVKNTSGTFKPSPVRTINGEGVNEFLQKVAVQADFHDADTRWNALFPSQPLIASGVTYLGSFRVGLYQGPNTTLSFANGTTKSAMNVAVVSKDFEGVNSGASFFKKFCSGPSPTSSSSTTTSTKTATSSTASPSHTGYPKPVIINPNLSLAGYHLNDTGYNDLAILSIPSYESPDVQAFQNVMRDFIRMSKAAGKTKLIFDLRGNGGGNAILGYDSFKQVFPQADQEPYGGTQFRANEALNITGQVVSDFAAGKTYAQQNKNVFDERFNNTSENDIFLYTVGFNYQHQLDIQDQNIKSWNQMFGPKRVNGDSYSSTLRYNFSDEDSYTYIGFSVIGFLNNTNETRTAQPFSADNMVMLHDGMCSSTCTIASELLKNQGSVRTIAIGGQPEFKPMQGVAGTKGAQNFAYDDIQVRLQIIHALGSPEQQAEWNKTALGKTAFATQLFKRTAYSGTGSPAGGVNLKDNLRKNDPSNTPLEFIYEAADCRMFFTMDMINDVREVWKGVADRMFKTAGSGVNRTRAQCVRGSEGDPSSISGGGQNRAGTVPPPIAPDAGVFDGGAVGMFGVGTMGWTVVGCVLAGMLVL